MRPALDEILAQFHQEHERSYGFKAEEEPVEFVALRLSAVGVIPKPQLPKIQRGDDTTTNAVKETRPVYFAETGGRVNCPDLRPLQARLRRRHHRPSNHRRGRLHNCHSSRLPSDRR